MTDPVDLSRLRMTEIEVARLTKSAREDRVRELMTEAHALLSIAIQDFVTTADKELAGIVVLFSGGNDSTVLAHLFRDIATHAGHANTGVGVERTRQFVRDTCQDWGLPLLERKAPRVDDSYRAMVLDQGFPGPAHHYKMFQRLKERALRIIRAEIIAGRSRTHRVVFLAGRRRQESGRRANVPEFEREGSIVWVSPLVNWTKIDLNAYRLMFDVPRNEVSDLIHMSGECLCGSFAHKGERDEISMWFPEAFVEINELEAELLKPEYDHIRPYAKVWGWGWDKPLTKSGNEAKPSKVGRLCQSCDATHDPEASEVLVL